MIACLQDIGIFPKLVERMKQRDSLSVDQMIRSYRHPRQLLFFNRRLEEIDTLCLQRSFSSFQSLLDIFIRAYSSESYICINDEINNWFSELSLNTSVQEDTNDAFHTVLMSIMEGLGLGECYKFIVSTKTSQLQSDVRDDETRYEGEVKSNSEFGISVGADSCTNGDDRLDSLDDRLAHQYTTGPKPVTGDLKPDGYRPMEGEVEYTISHKNLPAIVRIGVQRNINNKKSKRCVHFYDVSFLHIGIIHLNLLIFILTIIFSVLIYR